MTFQTCYHQQWRNKSILRLKAISCYKMIVLKISLLLLQAVQKGCHRLGGGGSAKRWRKVIGGGGGAWAISKQGNPAFSYRTGFHYYTVLLFLYNLLLLHCCVYKAHTAPLKLLLFQQCFTCITVSTKLLLLLRCFYCF